MKYFLSLLILFYSFGSFAGHVVLPQYYKFRVYLKDKGEVDYSLDDPNRFLTKEAVERKKKHGVKIDESDFPISGDYLNLVQKAGGEVVSHSKWLKTLVVMVPDSVKIEDIKLLPFVDSVKYVWRGKLDSYRYAPRPRLADVDSHNFGSSSSIYGETEAQFLIHNATNMYDAGFRGKGLKVGVIDAGFTNFDVIPLFNSVNLYAYADFVPQGDIFSANDHGTKVLSTMSVFQPGIMVGSAPEAQYCLLRSEDIVTEFPVEEDYWVRAIEYADSIGVDVVNTSLGYNSFDDSYLNYTHNDLTGRTSIMSIAADIAYDKGIIVVVSAGNEGNKNWKNTTPPGDAFNVISVGAIDTDSVIASFSSYGIMTDGRIKPDFVSVGVQTVTVNQYGIIGTTNGTSLSSPFLAGLITSLWSVNPDLHRSDLIRILWESADKYLETDPVYGSGIINFDLAYNRVLQSLETHSSSVEDNSVIIKPDKSDSYTVEFINMQYSYADYSIRLLDENGALLSQAAMADSNIISIAIGAEVIKNNDHIHFVIDGPSVNKTYRVKL